PYAQGSGSKYVLSGFSRTQVRLKADTTYFLVANCHGQRRLCGGQARHRNAVRRHAHVIQADLLEEMNRRGIAAVLAADAQLDIRPGLPAFFDGGANEEPDADGIDGA